MVVLYFKKYDDAKAISGHLRIWCSRRETHASRLSMQDLALPAILSTCGKRQAGTLFILVYAEQVGGQCPTGIEQFLCT
jgi:hypothetical protein